MEVISRKEAIEKGLRTYFTGKPCKHGHVAERYVSNGVCVECMKAHSTSDEKRKYSRQYYKDNAEQILEQQKQYCLDNAEQRKQTMRKWYEENREQRKKYWKKWYEENKEHKKGKEKKWREHNPEYKKQYYQENKEQINEYYRNRYATDESFKTLRICRRMLHRTLNATSSTKDTPTYEMLGYCNEQLKESIESKFLEGMSWDSYGDWHIDHIYPVARYIKDGVEDPSIINALDNLIPMWAEHNMEKNERTLEEYLEDREDLVELYGRFL